MSAEISPRLGIEKTEITFLHSRSTVIDCLQTHFQVYMDIRLFIVKNLKTKITHDTLFL